YSPLPTNLSQEIANSIARMQGNAAQPEQLNAGNCANPRFKGNLGGDVSPPDPLAKVKDLGGAGTQTGGGSGGDGPTDTATTVADAAGQTGAVKPVGGGSGTFQEASPVLYDRPASSS